MVPGVTAALAAAAATQRPLTRRGHGRSVSLSTAMTREGGLHAGRHADTEVFYMAGRQLARLAAGCWPRAGRPARRSTWCRAPAGPTSWAATTRWPRWRGRGAACRRPTVVVGGRRCTRRGRGAAAGRR